MSWIEVTCDACGAVYMKRACWAKRVSRHFCSRECAYAGKSEERAADPRLADQMARARAARPDQGNHYKTVALPDGTRVLEHRLIAERALGRPLRDGEVVHHRNGDIRDNRLENLEVMTHGEHSSLHRRAYLSDPENLARVVAAWRAGLARSKGVTP